MANKKNPDDEWIFSPDAAINKPVVSPVMPQPVGDPLLEGLDFGPSPGSVRKDDTVSGIVSPFFRGIRAGIPDVATMGSKAARMAGVSSTPTREQIIAEQEAEAKAEPKFSSWIAEQMYRAGQMMPASLAPTLAGVGTGALIGGPAGALIGGVAGGLGGAGLFGLSQAQETKERALAKGVDPGYAPLLTGLSEGGLEALSNVVPLGVVAKLIKQPVKAGIGALARTAGKAALGVGAGEVIPEMIQAGSQAAVEKSYGIRPDADPWGEALQTVAPTAIMSGITGGLIGGAHRMFGKKATDIETNDPIKEIRQRAAIEGAGIPQFSPDNVAQAVSDGIPLYVQLDSRRKQQMLDDFGRYFPDLNNVEQDMAKGYIQDLYRQPDRRTRSHTAGVETILPGEPVAEPLVQPGGGPVDILTGQASESEPAQARAANKARRVKPKEIDPVEAIRTSVENLAKQIESLNQRQVAVTNEINSVVPEQQASLNIEGEQPVTNVPQTGILEPDLASRMAAKRAKRNGATPGTPLPGWTPGEAPVSSSTYDKMQVEKLAKQQAKAAEPTKEPPKPRKRMVSVSEKKQQVAQKVVPIPDATPVPYVTKDNKQNTVLQTTPAEKLGNKTVIAFMNKDTGEVRQDQKGTTHSGWSRAGIKEADLDSWIPGWTSNGRFETNEMSKARSEQEAIQTEQGALNTGRSVSIKTAVDKSIPNKTIGKLAKIAAGKLGGENKVSFELSGKDVTQGLAAIKQDVRLSGDKMKQREGAPISSVLSDGTHTYSFEGNTLSIKKHETGRGYTVGLETTAIVPKVEKPAPVVQPKPTGVAPEQVIRGRGVEIEEGSPDIVHSKSAQSIPVQNRNARRSVMETMNEPAVAVGDMLHTPTTSYKIIKGQAGSTTEAVRENTPEKWSEILRKYNPASTNPKQQVTTNRLYREAHATVTPTSEKPKPTPPKGGGGKTVAKSEEKKVETIKPNREKAKQRLKQQLGELKKAEPVKPSKAEAKSEPAEKKRVPPTERKERETTAVKPQFKLDDVKFEGTRISTSRVEVRFPKAEDMDHGNISIRLDGEEKANIPATDLANPEKVASLIGKVIAKAHNVDAKTYTDLVLKEMTGGKESKQEEKGQEGKAEVVKEEPKQEEKIKTRSDLILKRYGRQITIEELASVIPTEHMGSYTSFLNRMREGLGMSNGEFSVFRKSHDLNALYIAESSKKPRMVRAAQERIKRETPKANWLNNVAAVYSESPNQREEANAKEDDRVFTVYQNALNKLSNTVLMQHGLDVEYYAPRKVDMNMKAGLDMLGSIFKKPVVLFDVSGKDASKINKSVAGYSFDGKIFINRNFVTSEVDHAAVHTVGHELIHELKKDNPQAWEELSSFIRQSPIYEQQVGQLGKYLGQDHLVAHDELVADVGARFIFTKDFWQNLSHKQPGMFERLVGYVRRFIDRVIRGMKFQTQFGDQALRKIYSDKILNTLDNFDTMIGRVMSDYAKMRQGKFNPTLNLDSNANPLVLSKMLPSSFKQWFGKSVLTEYGKPRTLFHGTIKDINGKFNTNRSNGSIDQRLGAHFAFDPLLADQFSFGQYTDFSEASNKNRLLYDKTADTYHLPGGRVYPVVIRATRPLDLSNSKLEDWQQVQHDAFLRLFRDGGRKQLFINTYADILGMDRTALSDAWSEMKKNNEWEKFFFEYDLPHLQEIDPDNKLQVAAADRLAREYKNELRKAGYDSLIYKHTDQHTKLGDPRAIIVFDSDQIQSIYTENSHGDMIHELRVGQTSVPRSVNDINYTESRFAEAERGFEKTRGLGSISAWDRLKDFASGAKRDLTRHFVHLDPAKYGDIANTLYKFQYSGDYSQKIAIDMLRDVVNGLSPKRYNVFRRMIVMPDLIDYMEKLEADPKFAGEKLMGFNNVDEARAFYAHYKQITSRDPLITSALARRKTMMDQWRNQMVNAGILPEHVLDNNRSDYFRHQVLDWMGATASGEEPSLLLGTQGESVRLRKSGWQRARKGSLHDYNTEYLQAEFEVLAQGIHQLEAKAALDHLKTYDKFEDLRAAWKEQMDQPGGERDFKFFAKKQGYVPWQPKKGNFLERMYTITDKALARVMAEQRDDPTETHQDLNKSMRGIKQQTVQGMPLPSWYLPQDVARQLDELEPPPDDSFFGKVTAKTLGAWKQWVLFNPLRLTKYVLNNTSGDLDIAIAYDPKILKHAKQAAIDLYKYTIDPSSMDTNTRSILEHALKQRVIDGGITIEEIGGMGRLQSSDIFKFLDDTHVELWKKFAKAPADYMKFVKKWANYRENILRLSAYRYFQEKVASGQVVYGASNKQEIDNIVDKDDKAAKLARELIGDYGNISKAGMWTRKHMIPFWSWMEINAPRYMRMLKNSKYEPESRMLGKLGTLGVAKGATLGAKAVALFLAINMFNKIFWPEEDDELNKTGRQQLHIILGRREDGTIRTLRFQGALSDALSWAGLSNMGQDFNDVVSGRKSMFKQMKEMAISPVQKIALGARPMERTMTEIALGKTMWPDLTNPRPIRDKTEHFFKSFSMDIPYRYAMNKPVRGVGEDSEALLFYRADPGEAAYYKIGQKTREFLSDHNVDLPEAIPSKRSNALYYYKQAKKYGDKDSEQHWLEQFKAEGGKMQNIMQSIKKMHPLASMPLQYRSKFFNSLDKQDREVYNMAVGWWSKTYKK